MCPKFNTLPPVLSLKDIGRNTFKSPNLASIQDIHLHVSPERMLGSPECFLLAARSCDGSYHSVHSNIENIFRQNAPQIRKGMFDNILKHMEYDEDAHGKRFVIFKKGNEALLIGDVVSALKRLSGR